MALFNGKCFLDILIEHFAGFGLRRFILCTGHKSGVIREHYNAISTDLEIIISDEYTRLGTAGSIKNAERHVESDAFLVTNGDSFCPTDILEFYCFHLQKQSSLSMVVTSAKKSTDYGSVSIDRDGRFTGFVEKKDDTAGWINAGIYLFNRELLSMIPPDKPFSLEYDLFPELINANAYAFQCTERLLDIGTPDRFETAKQYFADRLANLTKQNVSQSSM